MMPLRIYNKVSSKVSDVVKYIIEDDIFGKNEVSVIRKPKKVIFCLPSQTNCKMGCTFCHLTGTTRAAKNLSPAWVVSVVDLLIKEEKVQGLREDLLISFMGAGEPMLNCEGIQMSIMTLHTKYPKIKYALSTMMPSAGTMKNFTSWAKCLKAVSIKVHLSVHGVFNRGAIVKSVVPINKAIDLVKDYHYETGKPIEYHYTLVKGVNDSLEELQEFEVLIEGAPATIKFLTLSENNGCETSEVTEETLDGMFSGHEAVEFYDPPGRDVGASCGMFDQSIYNEP